MASPATSADFSTGPNSNAHVHNREAVDTEPATSIRVVLLDDEQSILKTWKAILDASGFEAVACERATDALTEIAKGCDCVLTDYHMPDMTGVEVIKQARLFSRAKFILMSGNDTDEVRRASFAAGADYVIAKPAPIMTVIGLIEKLTSKTQSS